MDLPRKQSQHEKNKIQSEGDPRIACYRWSNYSFRECQSKALAWFVQFAIRADLAQAVGRLRRGNDFNAVMNGYPEIQKKIPEILTLIREHHIVDESDLATIDLSLYHFPTLARFYDSARSNSFVREASLAELRIALEYVHKAVADSTVEELFSDEDGDFSVPVLHTVWGHKTSSAIQREAGVAEDKIPRERLFVVDLSAPVTVLKSQFLECLERTAKQKISAGPGYADWEDLGVLSYIDLEFWRLITFRGEIRQRVVPSVIYSDKLFYTAKNVRETTGPHVDKMLDTSSRAFSALQASASLELNAAIDFALNSEKCPNDPVSEEAFARWFPRTYPHDVPSLRRICRIFPEESSAQQEILDSLEQDGELDLDIAERIRRRDAAKSADGQDISKPWQKIADLVRETLSSATNAPDDCRECEPEGSPVASPQLPRLE